MIREATPADYPQLLAIYNKEIAQGTATFYTEPMSLEEWTVILEKKGGRYPLDVYELEGKAVAYVTLSPFGHEKEHAYSISAELSIYLDGSCQGKGIGSRLMAHILEKARGLEGIENIISTITAGNEGSIRLHEKMGFRYIGTIRHGARKFGRVLDVAYYQLVL